MSITGQAINSGTDIIAGAGIIGAIIALGTIALLIAIGVYVYFALAWMTIAKKMKHKYPWLAWIPFANIAMWLQMGGFAWQWIFLMFIPVFGWIAIFVMFIISNWRVFEKLKYPGWLSLALILDLIPGINGIGTIAYAIVIGVIAWQKPIKKRK